MRTQEQRRADLKIEVEENRMPVIENCSSGAGDLYTMGDLEALGWMHKHYTHDSEGEIDGWERYYFGPNPVAVNTHGAKKIQILNPEETLY